MGLQDLFNFQQRAVYEGLLDRTGLAKIAQREMDRAERQGEPLALMLVEVGNLDHIRSILGPAAGDVALSAVAEELTKMCGIACAVARLRSQEFAVLLPGRSTEELNELAEGVDRRIQGLALTEDGVGLKVSVGVGMFYPGENSWAQMLCRADMALFCAKDGGENRVAMDTGAAKNIEERRARATRPAL